MTDSAIDVALLVVLVSGWLVAVVAVGWTLWSVVTMGDDDFESEETKGGGDG